MPRITKAEVRASVANEPKKNIVKQEKIIRERKIKEEQPYPVISERTETPVQTEENLDNTGELQGVGGIGAPNSSHQDQTSSITKKSNISNLDPTPIQRRILAIDAQEVESARQEILDLREKVGVLELENNRIQEEKDQLEERLSDAHNHFLADDTLEESYRKKIYQINEDHNKSLMEKDKEISELKIEKLALEQELKETNSEKKEKLDNKLGNILGYILAAILGFGITGFVGLLVAKILFAMFTWLF